MCTVGAVLRWKLRGLGEAGDDRPSRGDRVTAIFLAWPPMTT